MLVRFLLKLADKFAVFGYLKKTYQRFRAYYYSIQKVDDKLIVFESYSSIKYADSPRAIYEYMLSSPTYKDYRFIWCFKDIEKHRDIENERTKLVKHDSQGYFLAFARAKYWVVNDWMSLRINKRPEQVFLQCWHGTPLKKLRHDIVDSVATPHRKNALKNNDKDAARFDYFISPSSFATEAFTSAFNLKKLGKQDIIIETGYPRNDYLINFEESEVEIIKKKLSIPSSKKVILYAPTWRDDQEAKAGGYEYKTQMDFDYLRDKISDKYVVLFRAHSMVGNGFNFDNYDGFVYDVTSCDEVNELYIISDVLITDYSSVFFDYANLKRPIIFYMYDREHYEKNLRGFYIDTEELPGDIATTKEQLAKNLKNLDEYYSRHTEKYREFNKKYNYLDDGNATKRVVEKVFS